MASKLEANSEWLVLGEIGRVHGLKGWLKLISFTSPIENILDYSLFHAEVGGRTQELELDEHSRLNKALLVHFKGYDDPETARLLTGTELAVANEKLPGLERGEFYWHQLQDLKVVNQIDQVFGRVSHLLETGANDVLVVKADSESIDDRERLIPYLMDSVIIEIDLESQTIRVDWEADYLD
ncbi:MAG: ribosome maturation factor RimM [Gammaproteobacteria bacterium]|nr:ribosome maturation factor RimM [Gammaproteobacteria bacterium]